MKGNISKTLLFSNISFLGDNNRAWVIKTRFGFLIVVLPEKISYIWHFCDIESPFS